MSTSTDYTIDLECLDRRIEEFGLEAVEAVADCAEYGTLQRRAIPNCGKTRIEKIRVEALNSRYESISGS